MIFIGLIKVERPSRSKIQGFIGVSLLDQPATTMSEQTDTDAGAGALNIHRCPSLDVYSAVLAAEMR